MVRKKVEAVPSDEQVHHLFARNEPPDIEHVPTLPELHARGLAKVVAYSSKGVATHYRPTAEGQKIIYAAMKQNAERRLKWHDRRSAST